MPSKIDICNLALTALRAGNIGSLDEISTERDACILHYDPTLLATLRAADWNFAADYKALAPDTDPVPPNWTYAYGRPANMVKARFILPDVKGDASPPFELAGDRIFSDKDSAWLCFTKLITDPTKFDPLFVQAFSFRLATRIAPAITAEKSWVQAAQTQYENIVREAWAVDASEGVVETPRNPEWLEVQGIANTVSFSIET